MDRRKTGCIKTDQLPGGSQINECPVELRILPGRRRITSKMIRAKYHEPPEKTRLIPKLNPLLKIQLHRLKGEILALPFTPLRSEIVDCIDRILTVDEEEGHR